MEQYCPRCNESQVTKSSNTSTAGRSAGLIGVLIANAATSYSCPKCGKIPLAEFPEEFQSGVKRKRVLSILGAIGVFLAVIVLLYIIR